MGLNLWSIPEINAHKNLKASSPIDKTVVDDSSGEKRCRFSIYKYSVTLLMMADSSSYIYIYHAKNDTKLHIVPFDRLNEKTPAEPPLNKKLEHAQIRMHHHCTMTKVWLMIWFLSLAKSLQHFVRWSSPSPTKKSQSAVVYVKVWGCVSSEKGVSKMRR